MPLNRPHGWRLGAGVLLIAIGLALLGYVAWAFYGSNVVARHHRAQVLDELDAAWRKGVARPATDRGEASEVIRIPRFGKDYRVPVLEGTTSSVLATGFGHYRSTAQPGQVGNFAVAAHRVTHGEPLRHLPDLRRGDLVYVDTMTTTYEYRLTTGGGDLVVPSAASWVLQPLPSNPDGGTQPPQRADQRLLTLTTCSELFHTDDRTVVFGVLVDSHARTPTRP